MRKKLVCLTACSWLVSLSGFTQNKLALSVYTGSGISYFSGAGAVSQSLYYRNGLSFPDAVDSIGNHFGRKTRANFSAGLELEYPMADRWSLLLNTQYEQTGAALKSDSVITPSGNFKTDGSYWINYFFVNIHPQLAFNIRKGYSCFSIRSGVEYSLGVNFSDQFDFIDQSGRSFSIGHSGGKPEVDDFRISAGATWQQQRWGLGLTYKHGLSNFNSGNTSKAMMRLFQLKLMYRLFGGLGLINRNVK